MNIVAKELSLKGSHFDNPHGLANRNNKSTAEDILNLSEILMEDKLLSQIVKVK